MARLTNSIRDEIVASLIGVTFKLRAEILEREEEILTDMIRNEFLGDWKKQYLTLPEYLQEESHIMNVQLRRLGQEHDHFYYHFHPKVEFTPYYGEQTRWRNAVNMLGKGHEPCGKPSCIDKQDLTKELINKLIKHADKWETFVADVKKLSSNVSNQLKACTTTEKLLKQWPEVAVHIPPAMNPLTVQIDRTQTNKLIACMEMGTCQ